MSQKEGAAVAKSGAWEETKEQAQVRPRRARPTTEGGCVPAPAQAQAAGRRPGRQARTIGIALPGAVRRTPAQAAPPASSHTSPSTFTSSATAGTGALRRRAKALAGSWSAGGAAKAPVRRSAAATRTVASARIASAAITNAMPIQTLIPLPHPRPPPPSQLRAACASAPRRVKRFSVTPLSMSSRPLASAPEIGWYSNDIAIAFRMCLYWRSIVLHSLFLSFSSCLGVLVVGRKSTKGNGWQEGR